MRTLILMRHAKSDWKQPGLADHDRPLNARGRRSAPLMAHKLKEQALSVDVILASSAQRVQETVALMQPIWSTDAEVLTERSLYLAPPSEILTNVRGLHDSWQSAMVVGHNPGMCALACHLAGQELEMPTAAVAVYDSSADSWLEAVDDNFQLAAYWKPRELES